MPRRWRLLIHLLPNTGTTLVNVSLTTFVMHGSLSCTHLAHYHWQSCWQSCWRSHPISRFCTPWFLSFKIPHQQVIVQTATWSVDYTATHSAGIIVILEYFGLRTLSEVLKNVSRCSSGLEPALARVRPLSTWICGSDILARSVVWTYLQGMLFQDLSRMLTNYITARLYTTVYLKRGMRAIPTSPLWDSNLLLVVVW